MGDQILGICFLVLLWSSATPARAHLLALPRHYRQYFQPPHRLVHSNRNSRVVCYAMCPSLLELEKLPEIKVTSCRLSTHRCQSLRPLHIDFLSRYSAPEPASLSLAFASSVSPPQPDTLGPGLPNPSALIPCTFLLHCAFILPFYTISPWKLRLHTTLHLIRLTTNNALLTGNVIHQGGDKPKFMLNAVPCRENQLTSSAQRIKHKTTSS